MSQKPILIATALVLVALGPLSAQEMKGHDHSSMPMNSAASSKAFEDANAKMHKEMAIDYSGNADVDFVRSMIPHHQGAIDMAKVELTHGKDPELRKLAEEVIKAQETEISHMRAWLKSHGQ